MIDIVLTAGGLLMTVVLIIAGGLLVWAHSFVDNEMRRGAAAVPVSGDRIGAGGLGGTSRVGVAMIGDFSSRDDEKQAENAAAR